MKKFILSLLVVFMTTTVIFAQAQKEKEVKNWFAQIEKTDSDAKKT